MCFFGILSLDTFGPHTGLLSYGLPKKMGAGPYGYMIKLATTQKSPSVAQMTSVVHAKNHVGKKKLCLQGNDTNYIFKSNKHPHFVSGKFTYI